MPVIYRGGYYPRSYYGYRYGYRPMYYARPAVIVAPHYAWYHPYYSVGGDFPMYGIYIICSITAIICILVIVIVCVGGCRSRRDPPVVEPVVGYDPYDPYYVDPYYPDPYYQDPYYAYPVDYAYGPTPRAPPPPPHGYPPEPPAHVQTAPKPKKTESKSKSKSKSAEPSPTPSVKSSENVTSGKTAKKSSTAKSEEPKK
ncbi:unnamed protein product [Caenorhabditis brenneri]